MELRIELSDDLAKKFTAACNLMGESSGEAAVKALAQYTREALIAGARSIGPAESIAATAAADGLSASSLRGEFIAWFKQQLTPKGKPYNPVTISGYAGRIQNTCGNPGFESVGASDIFEISDLTELELVVAKMRKCPAYAKEDSRTHNGLTAALKKYAQFLKQRRQAMSSSPEND